jgi:predicted esterase
MSSTERPDWAWYQTASELVAGGQLDAAEDTIATALNGGHLWRVSLLIAPTLDRLRGRPGFESLASEARRRVDERAIKPLVLTAMPRVASVAPLLLVFHGATGNAATEIDRWRPAAELGWIVAAAQSSQPATEDGFCWDPPRERIWQDLRVIAAQLPMHARIVTAGFSQGAWIALNAALKGDLFVSGTVVMVAPFAGPTANLEPAWRRMRIDVLVGENDTYRSDADRLASDLRGRGHHVDHEVIAGLGHAYPADFVQRLPALLKAR